METKTYKGFRDTGKVFVSSQRENYDYELPLYLNLVDHSPSGFNWGYGGSGPAQLAFAILYDYFDHKDVAFNNYQQFKWEVIAKLNQDKDFILTDEDILDFFFERKETCNVI